MLIVELLLYLAFQGSAGQAEPPVNPTGRLRVEGRHLKDPSGRAVILRGVNKPGFVDCPDGWWNRPGDTLYAGIGRWDPEAVKANLKELKKWGCNVVRFHTCVQYWKDNPETFRDQYRDVTYPKPYREMLKEVIGSAGAEGLYVVVDFYNVKLGSGQETLPWPPFSKHREVVSSRKEFLDLWKTVGRELGRFPHVLFELYNEPHGGTEERAEWFAFVQEAIDAVRAVAENVIIIQWDYGCWVNLDFPPPGNAASTLEWVEKYPLKGTNLVYSTHLYRNSGGGAGGGFAHRIKGGMVKCWEREDLVNALKLAGVERVVKDLGRPLLVGELGPYLRLEGVERQRELDWFRNMLAILKEWGIGTIAWVWHPEDHLAHGLLPKGNFFSGPNEGGRVFMDSLR